MGMQRVVLWAALVVGCASNRAAEPHTPQPPAGSEERAPSGPDIEAALKREHAPFPLQPVRFPQENFRASVEASAAPQVIVHDGMDEVLIPVEPLERLRCFVYGQYVDPGAAMMRVVTGATTTGGLSLQQLRPTKILAQGIDPMVFAEATYYGEKTYGLLKLAAFASDAASFLCLHDEPGYRQTFERIVKGFAASLQPPERTLDPLFGELHLIRVAGLEVGYERLRVFVLEDGRRADDVASLLLLPKSPTELSYNASFKLAESDPQGRIDTLRFYETVDGEPTVQVEVERRLESGDEYAYSGTREGAPVEGTFRSKEKSGLPGDAALESQVKSKLFGTPGTAIAFEQYDPELDLQKPIELTARPVEPASRTAEVLIGGRPAKARFDDAGRMDRLELDLGGATLVQERSARVGSLP